MKILTIVSLFIIGLIVTLKTKNPKAASNNPYTGAANSAAEAIAGEIQKDTSEGMREAGALPNPRPPIGASPEQPSASGTTTTSAEDRPMWVKETTGSGEERWKTTKRGAPKTSLWDKHNWGLDVYGDGAILSLTVRDSTTPIGRSQKEILWDSRGGKWLIRPDGVNKDTITASQEKEIFSESLELGIRPVAPTSEVRAIFRFKP